MLTPSTPSPATHIPITAPPENAIESALFIPLSFAAFAVLTFAFVATLIPKYPASVENTAPTTKQAAVTQFPIPNPISRNNTSTKNTSILYSAVRKAWAPSLIDDAISRILSVPALCLFTFAARKPAKMSAAIPNTGTTFKNISIKINLLLKLVTFILSQKKILYIVFSDFHFFLASLIKY